jgi:hypothetical protein
MSRICANDTISNTLTRVALQLSVRYVMDISYHKGWYKCIVSAPGLTSRSSVHFNDVFCSTDVTGFLCFERIYL